MVAHIQLAIAGRVKQKNVFLLTPAVENTPKINVVDSRKVSQKWDSLGATHCELGPLSSDQWYVLVKATSPLGIFIFTCRIKKLTVP